MLKNKFGMFKVLALALSVLMLVSLAACGNDGMDDAAIQDAINAAVQSQSAANAAEQEKVAASLKAEQEKAESERLAAEESLKAANEAAEKAAKEAADKAAAAEKAAAEAKKEAEAKAAEASKQAAEASKQAAEASKQAEEASKQASSLAQSAAQASKDALTATTTTDAPIAGEDLSAIKAKFATLKHQYTNPLGYGQYYLEADYEYIVLLFEKAAVELQNAMTVAAAESIYATLETEAAAVKNIKLAADQFAALVADLGDVEVDVFTTALEKKEAAELALAELYCDFQGYFVTKVDADLEPHDVDVYTMDAKWNSSKADAIGLKDSFKELNKANNKIDVLVDYIEGTLRADIGLLYTEDKGKFDEDGDDLDATNSAIIARAYYKYLLISKVNGGDFENAHYPIDWEYLRDEDTGDYIKVNGKKQYNLDAPIAWFTVEEFLDVYATPYLNAALEVTKDAAVQALEDALVAASKGATATIYTAIVTPVNNTNMMVSFGDAEDALEEIAEAFADEIEDITFVGDYKGNVSLEEAQIEIWTKYVDAYIAAANTLIEGTKETATEFYNDQYETDLDKLIEDYDEREDENSKAALAQKIANLDAKKAAFEANIEAATGYTFADFLNVELAKKYDKANYEANKAEYDVLAYIEADEVDSALINYINAVYTAALKKAISTSVGSTQTGALGDAAFLFIEDLMDFRDRLDPTLDVENTLYIPELRGNQIPYGNGENYVDGKIYSNTLKFESYLSIIDKAIADIQAVSVDNYKDKLITATTDKSKFGTDSANKEKALYWVNEEAMNWFFASEYDYAWLIAQETGTAGGDKGLTIRNKSLTGDFLTLTKTDWPVTFTQTAEEQAILAAQTIYANAFNEINASIIALDKTNFVSTYQKMVTKDSNADVKAILNNVKGNTELTDQVNAYIEAYTAKIASIAADKKYSFANNTFVSAATTNKYITNIEKPEVLFKFIDAELNNAENYAWDGLKTDLQGYVDQFNANFFDAKKESEVVNLYYYKQAAIEYITDTIEGYKNTYYTVSIQNSNGTYSTETKQNKGSYYKYDLDATKASVNGKAFEDQLDALLGSYVAKIAAVKLNEQTEVKDYYGNKLNTKVADWGTWTIDTAKQVVNAYVVDLLGYNAAGKYVGEEANAVKVVYSNTDYTAVDGNVYNTGDSQVLVKFRAYYEDIFTGYAPVVKE